MHLFLDQHVQYIVQTMMACSNEKCESERKNKNYSTEMRPRVKQHQTALDKMTADEKL